jgi:hypothetical protein
VCKEVVRSRGSVPDLFVGPGVGQIYFAGLRPHIGECIEEVGERLSRHIPWEIIAGVDA